ncbi:MAG: hypothetical protein KGL13_00315 [Gammaproteobacteria bacterium]|nr:hypothetical protein [Gammaproteobacteria bacterium]MDE2344886.1 hypothetical protein [Gammaproteobacteria bacterium]
MSALLRGTAWMLAEIAHGRNFASAYAGEQRQTGQRGMLSGFACASCKLR